MATAIGPVAVVNGIPSTLGPFAPGVDCRRHSLAFNVGAWAGVALTVQFLVSEDGVNYRFRGLITYAGPVSAWTRNTTGAIGPTFSIHERATAATRVKFVVSADGAFASSGGSYDAAAVAGP